MPMPTAADKKPMLDHRGAVILCDYIDRMQNGKYLLVGTHTHLICFDEQLIHPGLLCYVRAQVERQPPSGEQHRLVVQLISRDAAPNQEPIQRVEVHLRPPATPNEPLELPIRLPPMRVACPVPVVQLGDDEAIGLSYTVWAEMDGTTLASCPLNIIFRRPPPQEAAMNILTQDHPTGLEGLHIRQATPEQATAAMTVLPIAHDPDGTIALYRWLDQHGAQRGSQADMLGI